MRRCIVLGQMAREQGDSPVGALLAKDGRIAAEGIEAGRSRKDITYHAEIEAIRALIQQTGDTDLSGYTLYTTHEPCIMCSYVIRHHKIARIVWGISTGAIGGYSSDYKLLKDTVLEKWGAPPEIVAGVLEADCRLLHQENKLK